MRLQEGGEASPYKRGPGDTSPRKVLQAIRPLYLTEYHKASNLTHRITSNGETNEYTLL